MRTIFVLSVLLLPLSGVDVRLRAPATQGGGQTLPVSAYSQTSPVQLTFEQPHDLAPGDTVHCVGMRGNPRLRGYLRVRAVLSSMAITVADLHGADIAATTGSGIDVDTAHEGVQLGYCGKVATFTLREGPRGIWPIAGSPQSVRMTDPDGAGPLVAPGVTDDSAGWAYLSSRNDIVATPTGCDGKTAALCPVEEQYVKAPTDRIGYGYGLAMLALGWKMDSTKEHWKNAALYYLRNFEISFPPARPCFGCFTGIGSQAEGDDTDYPSFAISGFGWAYALLRDEMTAVERTAFVRKVWSDKRTNCTNSLSNLAGKMTGDGTILTTPDAGGLEPGDTILIRTAVRQYDTASGDLLEITVTESSGVARFAEGVPMPRTGTVRISGSGVAGLDGWYIGVINGQTLTFTTTAAPGVYSGVELKLMSPGASADRVRRQWVQIVTVDRSKNPQEVTVNVPVSTVAYNSPWGKVQKNWQNNFCGVYWLSCHHESHDFFQNFRTAKPAAAMTVSQAFVTLTADSWPEFEDLALPFDVRIGDAEIIRVIGRDPATRRLLVERGQDWTVPAAHTLGAELFYTPDVGANISLSTEEWEMMLGPYYQNKTNSFLPPFLVVAMATADEADEARWYLEYHWNLYYDYYWRIQKRLFAGPNYAGPGNLGYTFGRWADSTSMLAVAALNSFTQPLDLRFSAQRDISEWYYSIARPGDTQAHIAWGDTSQSRYFEKDELVTLWTAAYLYPDAPETQRAIDFYYREWNWLDSASPEEWIIYRLVYNSSTNPRMDYREGPTARAFDEKEPGLDSIAGGLHSRTSWTDPMATLVWAPVVPGGDHNGVYIFPGLAILAKGKADLISGSTIGAASGNDLRSQYAVQVQKTNGIGIVTGQNAGVSAPLIRLQSPAPAGGGVVELHSDSSYVSLPRYVTVPEGASSVAAAVLTYQTPLASTATISLRGTNEIAAYQRANAVVGTVDPKQAQIQAVTIPGPVTAGNYVEGVVTLEGPAPVGGVTVLLNSDHAGINVPASIRIRAGVSSSLFHVSAAPGSTGAFRITAENANSVTSIEAGIIEAAPTPVAVVHFGLSSSDTAQGGLRLDGHGRSISRRKLGPDFAYMRSDNSVVYDKTADTADVAEAHRDVVHLKPTSGQDYVLTYDRLLHTRKGHQDVLRLPYHRMSHFDGAVEQTPQTVYERRGFEVEFTSPQYGVRVNTRILHPSDPALLTDDNTSIYATRLAVYGGQQLENDFLAVHQPCANTTCTPPTWRMIPSSQGQRVVQIDDDQGTWIVSFSKGTKAMVPSISLNAESYTGSANFIITGLSSVKPFTKYSVMRDGETLLDEAEVFEDGTLRFSASFGSGGGFTITSTGAAPLEILTPSLPLGMTGAPYAATLSGQGGVPPYSWSIQSGAICSGLQLTVDRVTGTPDTAGTCSFSIRLTDQMEQFVERSYSLTVRAPSLALGIATNSLAAAGIGEPYAAVLSALGGEPPYSWNKESGGLPGGIVLSSGGVLSGSATQEGDFPFVAKVTDSKGATASKPFVLRVSVAALEIETSSLPPGYADTRYEAQLTASGGLAPYTWSLLSGEWPEGLELRSNGLLEGMSVRGWSSQVTLRVQDWTGRSLDKAYQIHIRNSPGILTAAQATAAHTRIAVRYGRYGLTAEKSCSLELSADASFANIVESRMDGGGAALRTAVFGEPAPLNAGQGYYFRATCGSETTQRLVATRAARPAASRLVWTEIHPMNLAAGESLRMEFGSSPALGEAQAMVCTTRCVAALPGTSGEMLYHRTVVLDSSGRVIRRGRIQTTVPE